jgi:hypothetical protein
MTGLRPQAGPFHAAKLRKRFAKLTQVTPAPYFRSLNSFLVIPHVMSFRVFALSCLLTSFASVLPSLSIFPPITTYSS